MGLWNFDSKPMQALSAFADIILLNLCWLIGSLPIVTIGASTAAVFTTLHKRNIQEETRILKTFFSSWKADFKFSTILFLLQTAASVLLLSNVWLFSFWRKPDMLGTVLTILSAAGLAVVSGTAALFYPQLGRYRNTFFGYLKNALLLCLGRFWLTCAVLLILLIPVFAAVIFRTVLLRMGILWLTFGHAAVFFLANRVVSVIFKPIDSLLQENTQADFNAQNERAESI